VDDLFERFICADLLQTEWAIWSSPSEVASRAAEGVIRGGYWRRGCNPKDTKPRASSVAGLVSCRLWKGWRRGYGSKDAKSRAFSVAGLVSYKRRKSWRRGCNSKDTKPRASSVAGLVSCITSHQITLHNITSHQYLQSLWSLWFKIVQMASPALHCRRKMPSSLSSSHCTAVTAVTSMVAMVARVTSVTPATRRLKSSHSSHSRVSSHSGHSGLKSSKRRLPALHCRRMTPAPLSTIYFPHCCHSSDSQPLWPPEPSFSHTSHTPFEKQQQQSQQSQQGLQSLWSLWFKIVQMTSPALHCRRKMPSHLSSSHCTAVTAVTSVALIARGTFSHTSHTPLKKQSQQSRQCLQSLWSLWLKIVETASVGLTLPPEDASSLSSSHCTAVKAVNSSRSGRQSHVQSHQPHAA
jgi:hypothetical protein